MHGYQIIQEITERSGGAWRPSPGSVYPALQLLEDEGLVRTEQSDGRRVVQLTDAGREYAESRREELAAAFEVLTDGPGDDVLEVQNLVGQVMMAFGQVMQAGTAAQVTEAKKVLTQARKSLYVILAQDEEAPQETTPAEDDE
jgi:DNA-binding PadR family transcriptional regulator